MIYKQFKDLQLSSLGLGCMRLPQLPDNGGIDEAMTAQMVEYCMKQGVNYFDTAYVYHGGKSEVVMGQILSRYDRKSFYLADKFPGFDPTFFTKVPEIFEEQLGRCQVDYFDFYLCHNVCERNIDSYMDREIGIIPYFLEQKAAGRIKHLGFSTHAELPALERFLEAYGEHMEFCQIQLNYLDWTWQKAEEKVALLRKYGIPVWVMEPLRGGKLAVLTERDKALLEEVCGKEEAPVSCAFRFLRNIPEVTMILSGMSDMDQLMENVATFSQEQIMEPEQFDAMAQLGKKMIEAVPCTACRYCTDYCPMSLDIPKLMRLYNEHRFTGSTYALNSLPEEKKPHNCLGCRQCEGFCPQNIPISEKMKELSKI